MVLPEPLAKAGQRGVNLRAALAVLADGRPRTAKEIVEAGIARHLFRIARPPKSCMCR